MLQWPWLFSRSDLPRVSFVDAFFMPTDQFPKQEAAKELLHINEDANTVVEENPAASMANVELSSHSVMCPALL